MPTTKVKYLPGSEQFANLTDLFFRTCQQFHNKVAFVYYEHELTYQDFEQEVLLFSAWLKHELKLPANSKVAICLPNCLQYPISVFASFVAGYTIVNLNPMFTPDELAQILADSGAEILISLDLLQPKIEIALNKLLTNPKNIKQNGRLKYIVYTGLLDLVNKNNCQTLWLASKIKLKLNWQKIKLLYKKFIGQLPRSFALTKYSFLEYQKLAGQDFKQPKDLKQQKAFNYQQQINHLALLQYTGGTTGKPKAAMLSQQNLIANIIQASAWITPALQRQGHQQSQRLGQDQGNKLEQAQGQRQRHELGLRQEQEQEVIITALPLYHIFAFLANFLLFFKLGAKNVLITDPRNITELIQTLKNHNFSCLTGVNTLYKALLKKPEFAKLNFSNLKLSVASGMPIEAQVKQDWADITGTKLLVAYGLTEASPAVSMHPTSPKIIYPEESVGLPLPATTISIRDLKGLELAANEIGEIWVQGPQVMQGYWLQPEATRESLINNWLKTGDLGYLDSQGYLHIAGREKDLIIVSGFNVYPDEIEAVIAGIPAVAEVGVIGIADQHSGEVPKAYIVLKPNYKLTQDEVKTYCKEHLTGYKIPKFIEFIKELPKSHIGKPLRKKLRETTTVKN